MSVRIYQLSKEVGMSNKEVIDILKKKGLDVSSPSSTIPNIYADSFLQEFKPKAASEVSLPPPSQVGSTPKTPPQTQSIFSANLQKQLAYSSLNETKKPQQSTLPPSKPSLTPEIPVQEQKQELPPTLSTQDLQQQLTASTFQKTNKVKPATPPPILPSRLSSTPKTPIQEQRQSTPPPSPTLSAKDLQQQLANASIQKTQKTKWTAPPTPLRPSLTPRTLAKEQRQNTTTSIPIPPSKQPLQQPIQETKEVKPAFLPPPTNHFVKSSQQIEEEKRKAEEPKRSFVLPPRPSTPYRPETKLASSTPPQVHKPSPATPFAPPLPKQSESPKASPPLSPGPKTTAAPSENKVDLLTKTIRCKPPIVVRDFSILLDIKPFRLISELMEMGIFASMNQTIEVETAQKIASKHGFTLEVQHRGETQAPLKEKKPQPAIEETKIFPPRPPIVCVLGHVDHGKTSLLDTIRKTNVAAGEAGGITQHTGAYQVEHNGHKITFIDTPGHAAFSKMRERGANITDIAILVVAADDTFMPQTDEALKFVKKANVPTVIAINKMDVKGANPEKIKQQMQERGIAPEEWGGETLTAQISATKGTNIDQLLDLILLQAEMQELKANPNCPPEGVILESQVETGLGSTANIIVQKGTLKLGDILVAGSEFCKVRAMIDDKGQRVQTAEPSKPVKIVGWSSTPDSGTLFKTVKNEKEAKQLTESFVIEQKQRELQATSAQTANLDNLMNAIAESKQKTLKVIIKGDVHGSVEALKACLEDIKSNKVRLDIIGAEIGSINKNDIIQAHTGDASIIGFNTKFDGGAQALAKQYNIPVIQHNIIYALITQVKEAMAELLEPELQEVKIGAAQVRNIFELSKAMIAGCMVTEGRVLRDAYAKLLRPKQPNPVHRGKIVSLKRFKEDASEVRAGYECGIQIENFDAYQVGDTIECFEIKKIQPSL